LWKHCRGNWVSRDPVLPQPKEEGSLHLSLALHPLAEVDQRARPQPKEEGSLHLSLVLHPLAEVDQRAGKKLNHHQRQRKKRKRLLINSSRSY
jgi:hypothetical protein